MAYIIGEPLGSYFVGDAPTSFTVEVTTEAGDIADLSLVTGVTATINGTVSVDAAVVDDTIVVTLPAESLFTSQGLYSLNLTLQVPIGLVRVAPAMFPVEAEDGWHTLDSIRQEWRDAPENDSLLYSLLSTARFQCEEFAPAYTGLVPLRYRQAQAMQTRNLYISTKADPSGNTGDEGFSIRPFPMDWVVKGILRPKRGRPVAA